MPRSSPNSCRFALQGGPDSESARNQQPSVSDADEYWKALTRASASSRTTMVYDDAMALAKRRSRKDVRRSVTLPPEVARQVDTIAKQRRLSDNHVLVELIEQGIEVRQQKQRAFFELAERFRAASDPEQVKRLGDELGRFVFGE